MPNGDSDHCGNCWHNRVNVGRASTLEERRGPVFCTVRNVAVQSGWHTYCANHYVNDKTPIGPMFGCDGEGERIPYHGACYPGSCTVAACTVCGAASKERMGIKVTDEKPGVLQFCGSLHYVRWWKQMHPGEPLRWDCDAELHQSRADKVFVRMQRSLELAVAYIERKDRVGARTMLNDVLRDGDSAQQVRARELLRQC